jgi:hypothetical protein
MADLAVVAVVLWASNSSGDLRFETGWQGLGLGSWKGTAGNDSSA